jgi:GrpB-like predicted nucleotidyltransferase (UPF0157 family)
VTLPRADEVGARVAALRDRVATGDLEIFGSPVDDPVVVVPADPEWHARFERCRRRIADALGPAALRIDHVGSTAVPGLAAKPVIDVQISVAVLTDEAAYAPALAALGWPLRLREPEQRFFREPAGLRRTTHVHVCEASSRWEWRHLLFRDYLRTHPARAAEYGALKVALAERYREDRVSYTEAKGPFIDETTALAETWAKETGWQL